MGAAGKQQAQNNLYFFNNNMIEEFSVSTSKRYQLIDITEKIEEIVKNSKIKEGMVLVFILHSTAGILINENEEGLKNDWLKVLEKLVSGFDFEHNKNDNNADSHILAGLIGQEKLLIIENGKVVRGTWQNIFFAEFDGPRTRKIIVKVFEA